MLGQQRQAIDEGSLRFVTEGDAEALHDLRVAMRRMHSLFVAFAPAFIPHASFPTSLRLLQKQTNHARDLEVSLTILRNSPFQLPWLEHQWQDELDKEYVRLRHTLPETWEALAADVSDPMTLLRHEQHRVSLGCLTANLLEKKTKLLTKQRKRLCKNWSDKAAHTLRITGKQTRYLLEPFSDGTTTLHSAVSQLKDFQDILGDYHDMVVLRNKLKQLQSGVTPDLARQLASVRKHLKRQRKQLRKHFIRKFCDKGGKNIGNLLQQACVVLAES